MKQIQNRSTITLQRIVVFVSKKVIEDFVGDEDDLESGAEWEATGADGGWGVFSGAGVGKSPGN